MVEKLCVFCKHWQFDGGEQGYSEYTPGTDASMDCAKNHYGRTFTLVNLNGPEDFRKIILTAETCPDYEQVPASPSGVGGPQCIHGSPLPGWCDDCQDKGHPT